MSHKYKKYKIKIILPWTLFATFMRENWSNTIWYLANIHRFLIYRVSHQYVDNFGLNFASLKTVYLKKVRPVLKNYMVGTKTWSPFEQRWFLILPNNVHFFFSGKNILLKTDLFKNVVNVKTMVVVVYKI